MPKARVRVGTVAWAIPRPFREQFPPEGSLLERYAARFDSVEIASTFYRLPRASTIERWRELVPASFRFAVKLPRSITHDAALRGIRAELRGFVGLCESFGEKLGPLLVQLAPSHAFDARVVGAFLRELRAQHEGPIVLEPRHPTFFSDRARELLFRHRIARVAADPPLCPGGDEPDADPSVVYFRLHGSPRIYFDVYEPAFIERLAIRLDRAAQGAREVWCIFDNTALGGATHDAIALQNRLLRGFRAKRRPDRS